MIFITLGSQKFQFNRLLKTMDKLVGNGEITDKVFAQTGYSDYTPINFEYKNFLERDVFFREMDKAEIVITHGGTGAIIGAVKKGKKVIAVPRLSKFGEHVDDHQLQIVSQFRDLELLCECRDTEEIGKALKLIKNAKFNTYHSNTKAIIDSIENFINM